jgi:transcriptional regulator with XRE-family HTH domain
VAAAPTVRQRRLGVELRRLRERMGPTAEEIATRLDWSPSKLSRIENARIGVRVSDVRLLLEIYHVDEVHMGEILALAQAATQPGWWARYSDVLPGKFLTYVALEDEASAAFTYATYVMPGLLQSEIYARRNMETSRAITITTPAEIDRQVEARMRRQELLRKENPLHLSAVIDESVMLRTVGDREVMHRQIAWLIEMAQLPNVEIFVLPLEVHREPIVTESFTLLEFSPSYDVDFHDVAYIDNLSIVAELQEDAITNMYRMSWSALHRASLSVDDSLEFMIRLRDEKWRR